MLRLSEAGVDAREGTSSKSTSCLKNPTGGLTFSTWSCWAINSPTMMKVGENGVADGVEEDWNAKSGLESRRLPACYLLQVLEETT